jgi:hypothetical protein
LLPADYGANSLPGLLVCVLHPVADTSRGDQVRYLFLERQDSLAVALASQQTNTWQKAAAALVVPVVVVAMAIAVVEDVGIVVIVIAVIVILVVVTKLSSSWPPSHSVLAAQNPPARLRTCDEPRGQPTNERVSEPFFGHTARNVRDVVRQLCRQTGRSMNERVGINSQLFGLSAPVTELDIAETEFATELHGKLDTLNVDLGIREDAGQIV